MKNKPIISFNILSSEVAVCKTAILFAPFYLNNLEVCEDEEIKKYEDFIVWGHFQLFYSIMSILYSH